MTVMTDNQEFLTRLFSGREIPIIRSSLFDHVPTMLPVTTGFNRAEGMLLGLAIGDSLGNTSEGRHPEERLMKHGEIRSYLPNRRANGRRIGLPSDDSQMSFWTLEQMIEDRGVVPANIAECFTWRPIKGIGSTVAAYLDNYRYGEPWYQAGIPSAGNGAIMRIAPMMLPYLRQPSEAMWADVALVSMITHRDSVSISSCLAFVSMLWDLLGMANAPDPDWYARSFIDVTAKLEMRAVYRVNSERYCSYRGNLSDYVRFIIRDAISNDWPVLKACNTWYSGAYLLETIPSVLYILMKHGHDPEEALVRAVNDTWDNDTVGALVGAAVGALHGIEAFPGKWVNKLTGRTGDNDDGRMCELLAQARELWWEKSSPYYDPNI